MLFLLLLLEKAGAENFQGAILVLVLAPLVLALHHHSGGNVRDSNGRTRLVYVLSAGPAGAERVNLNVVHVEVHVHIFGLRQYRHSGSGRLDAALGLGLRNPLDAMDAALKLKTGVGTLAGDLHRDLLKAPELRGILIQDVDMEPLVLSIHAVHAEQRARKKCRLFSPGAGSDLQNDISVVVGILGEQQDFQLLGKLQCILPGLLQFLRGQFLEFRVLTALFEQCFCLPPIILCLDPLAIFLHDRGQRAELLHELGIFPNVRGDLRVRKHFLYLFKPVLYGRQFLKHRISLPGGDSLPEWPAQPSCAEA